MMKKNNLFRDPNVWIGIGLAAIVIPMLIYAIVTHVRREPEDLGFMPCPGSDSSVLESAGKSLVPRFAPDGSWWTIIADKTISKEVLDYGVKMWNERIGKRVFDARVDPDWFTDPGYALSNEYKFGTASITLATEPQGDGAGGITHHNYDKATCEVYWVEITLNPLYTHDTASYKAAMVHELGHVLLLEHDDDDHPTSIMRKRLNPRGVILDHDAEIVRELWMRMLQGGPLSS